ncbi:hypothetical protein [Paenibacillus thalictri]|uniref:Uncharacterized protein n=1 Tax=Paenibacillus thalictri TaxID=2527873 RepID=A0A4Q9DPD0_9BACL|nr:hypothetical protein [Paenibacillus thalictri]TBL76078.1 hypothetical protein EYB31_21260 [Paenibacillus thalictri]
MTNHLDINDLPHYRYKGLKEGKLLQHIITTSRDILLGQIYHLKVEINNEADLRLHFSYILKKVGELFEFGNDHHLKINLEAPFHSQTTLLKSGSNKSKIDIALEWYGGTHFVSSCAIELKYFLWSGLREPQNRFDVYCDLKNLEEYVQQNALYQMGYFLLGTDNPHYVNQDSYSSATKDFDIRHNTTYKAGTELIYTTRNNTARTVCLSKDYHFQWQQVSHYYFLDHFIYKSYK